MNAMQTTDLKEENRLLIMELRQLVNSCARTVEDLERTQRRLYRRHDELEALLRANKIEVPLWAGPEESV